MPRSVLIGATVALASSGALAQDAAPEGATAARANAPALCTDRPSKATSACTVPEGSFQLEADLINWARFDSKEARRDTILYTNPTLKYGINKSTDKEASITPDVSIRGRDDTGVTRGHGVGDFFLRIKQRLSAADVKAHFAIISYLKVPTAQFGIGNRKVEGGVVTTGVFYAARRVFPHSYAGDRRSRGRRHSRPSSAAGWSVEPRQYIVTQADCQCRVVDRPEL